MIHIVSVADLKVSTKPGDLLVTYALGSCLGIAIYDPVINVGGMLHAMLPQSTIDPMKAQKNPSMFVDTGVPELFRRCYDVGAQRQRLIIKVAGGASIHGSDADDPFQIGKRNFIMFRKLLWKNGLLLRAFDVGGSISRTMSLDISNGRVILKSNGQQSEL